jgi:hypothetical protein
VPALKMFTNSRVGAIVGHGVLSRATQQNGPFPEFGKSLLQATMF